MKKLKNVIIKILMLPFLLAVILTMLIGFVTFLATILFLETKSIDEFNAKISQLTQYIENFNIQLENK